MKPSVLVEALLLLIEQRVPVHIWGACGIGKSQIVAQVAKRLSWDFRDIRAVQLDPVDLRGLPRITANWTEWVPPKFLPTEGKGILLLDELTSAPQLTQAGCYQLVLDGKLGEYVLPEGWVVVAAGNPASERGVHFSMPRPLRNRFEHLVLEPEPTEWCQWAIQENIRNEIIALLRFKPDLLHDSDATTDQNAWRTPRTWEMASKILDGLSKRSIALDSALAFGMFEGAIGPGAAAELVGFLQLFRQLPSIDEVLLNPESAPLPSDPSSQIAIATALGRVLNDQSITKGMKYLKRMATEMRVLAMRDAAVRDRSITHTAEFIEFGIQHAEII
jgi:MoxR-like ATPase